MLSLEQIRTCVQEEVYGELAEWGTSSRVINANWTMEPLALFMNKLCDPLIDKICKRIEQEIKEDISF